MYTLQNVLGNHIISWLKLMFSLYAFSHSNVIKKGRHLRLGFLSHEWRLLSHPLPLKRYSESRCFWGRDYLSNNHRFYNDAWSFSEIFVFSDYHGFREKGEFQTFGKIHGNCQRMYGLSHFCSQNSSFLESKKAAIINDGLFLLLFSLPMYKEVHLHSFLFFPGHIIFLMNFHW